MSGTKIDIQWSPVDENLFITTGSAITLYSVVDEPETDHQIVNQVEKSSKSSRVIQLDSKSEWPLIKCVSWCPKRDLKNVFAIAQTNGRINIFGFGEQSDDIIGKEFSVRYNRHCNYASWNPQETNLIAQGMDRYRTESSIMIWDVMRDLGMEMSDRNRHSFSEGTITKPLCETGIGETSQSFSWFPHDPKVFITGMSGKYIRFYDIREISKHRNAVSHRCVNGISIDPADSMRFASYAEDMVALWDLRNFDKPISVISENKAVVKLSWCPTRSGLLSVLCKDNSYVKLHNIRLALFGSDDFEQTYIARNIQTLPKSTLSSFCWHPWHENKMMTVTPNGHLKDLVVYEHLPINWSSDLKLNMPISDNRMNCTKVVQEDISDVMRRRVKLGYGKHHENIGITMEAIEKEKHLQGLWKWIHKIKDLEASKTAANKKKVSLAKGILALLQLEESPLNSEVAPWQWKDSEGVKYAGKRVYRSLERSIALQICGWSPTQDELEFVRSMAAAHEPERAAAIALFYLHIKIALNILSDPAQFDSPDKSTLQAVAMALSGYTEEKNTLWHKTCDALRSRLIHPYLRAIFAFLSAEDENYDEVLNAISVEDRIAFALIYLPDNKLKSYLLRLCEELTEKGDLSGILLTGMSSRGISLLSRYMDLTSDVQTVALAAVHSASPEVMENKHVVEWVNSYRDLLDRWKMWHERASFDIMRQNLVQNFKVPPQILVSCTFCRKPVSANMSLMNKFRSNMSMLSRGLQNPAKVTCCQGCRKAFPRCAICLNNMGTLSGAGVELHKGEKLSPFEEWFTWCQSCRHGGHAGHIVEWFREHIECPVTGCSCECVRKDALSQRLLPVKKPPGNALASKS